MSHNKVAQIQDWTDRVLAKHVETADETKRKLSIQEALKEHYITLTPILADLHIIFDMRSAKIVNRFFDKDNVKTREEAAAELHTYKEVQQLIESFFAGKTKEYFHATRRDRVRGPS